MELETYKFLLRQGKFLCQPLVFLNACQSAGGADELRRTFNLPKVFIQHGAAAVIATAKALAIFTADTFPYEWAKIQNSLGDAYFNKIQGDKAKNLEIAIACYQAALQIYTREAFPYEWASTCKNLGDAYTEKTHGDKLNNVDSLNNIEYAILFYEDALEIYNRETFPDECVIIREKLSNAHYLLEYYQRELELTNLSQLNTRDEALARIELVKTNILDLEVDAIVIPTSPFLDFTGQTSSKSPVRLRPNFY